MADSGRGLDVGGLHTRLQNVRSQRRDPDALILNFTYGPLQGSISKPGVVLTVGRTKVSSIWIKDPAVSERHAKIKWTGTAWELRDVGSSNGTSYNARDLQEEEPVILKSGDEIAFGQASVCTVEVKLKMQAEASVLDVLLAQIGSHTDSLQAESERSDALDDDLWRTSRLELESLATR